MPEVEFAILGAGALGSIIGAHLARSGQSVVMLVRARRAQQIASDGLRIKGLVEFSQPVPTISDPSQLTGAGVLIVATKTYDTEAAIATLRGANIGVSLSIQNGLLKDDLLAAAFGRERVLGSLANLSGELLGSGEVLFRR
jgi:2-dehydropantoate 2-reductase